LIKFSVITEKDNTTKSTPHHERDSKLALIAQVVVNLLGIYDQSVVNKLYEKGSSAVEGKHFDLDILMGGDMKFLQLVLGLGGSLCNYSCPFSQTDLTRTGIISNSYNEMLEA
jgi:hypothetical protein